MPEDATQQAEVDGTSRTFRAARILVATWRKPKTERRGLETVEVGRGGFIRADVALRTSVPHIFAAGELLGEIMYVHTIAYDSALAAEIALQGGDRARDYTALPWVIFTDPQMAGVGLHEQQVAEESLEVDIAVLPMSHAPGASPPATRGSHEVIAREILRPAGGAALARGRVLAPGKIPNC